MKTRKNHKTGQVSVTMDYTEIAAFQIGLRELQGRWEIKANKSDDIMKDFYNELADEMTEKLAELHKAEQWAYYHKTTMS